MDGIAKVGFVGLGNMGAPMARNIAKAGLALVVHDADAERARRFAAEHGATAATGASSFGDVDAVVTMLPTGRIVREAMLEWSGGIGNAMKRGALLVDMSSSEPTGTRELGAALSPRGVMVVDAPVSGGVPKAEAGTLAIMIGGDDPAAIERAKPLLATMGQRLFLTGPLGSGHAMKGLNNYVAAAGYTAAAEALIVGRKFGLEPGAMVEILNASTGRNFSTEFTLKEHVVPGRFATGFALGLLAKDVGIAADLAAAIDVQAPVAQLLKKMWAEASASLGADVDHSNAIKAWAKAGGVEFDGGAGPA